MTESSLIVDRVRYDAYGPSYDDMGRGKRVIATVEYEAQQGVATLNKAQ